MKDAESESFAWERTVELQTLPVFDQPNAQSSHAVVACFVLRIPRSTLLRNIVVECESNGLLALNPDIPPVRAVIFHVTDSSRPRSTYGQGTVLLQQKWHSLESGAECASSSAHEDSVAQPHDKGGYCQVLLATLAMSRPQTAHGKEKKRADCKRGAKQSRNPHIKLP